MLTLDDLKLYYERGYIELRIDLYRTEIPDKQSQLTDRQIKTVLAKKKLSITVCGKKIITAKRSGKVALY